MESHWVKLTSANFMAVTRIVLPGTDEKLRKMAPSQKLLSESFPSIWQHAVVLPFSNCKKVIMG